MSVYFKLQVNIPGTKEKEFNLTKKIMKKIKKDNNYDHKYQALLHVFTHYAELTGFENNPSEDLIGENDIEIINDITEEIVIGWWNTFKKVQKAIIDPTYLTGDFERYGIEVPEDLFLKEPFERNEWIRDKLMEIDKQLKEARE